MSETYSAQTTATCIVAFFHGRSSTMHLVSRAPRVVSKAKHNDAELSSVAVMNSCKTTKTLQFGETGE